MPWSWGRSKVLSVKLNSIIWLRNVVDKIAWKHDVSTDEVEEALNDARRFRFIEKGDFENEHLYAALGQTQAGRYLTVFFIRKASGEALIVSARDATKKERKTYGKR